MAKLLERLGRFCAQHAWAVIVTWVAILALSFVGFGLFHGPMSTTIDLPNTPTSKVADQLSKNFKKASGGSSQIVFTATDKFTPEHRKGIAQALKNAEKVKDVKTATDPFAAQQKLDRGMQKMAAGEHKLAEAEERAKAGQAQLDQGKKQIEAGQAQLDQAKAAMPEAEAQLAPQQAELDQQKQLLEEKQRELNSGKAKLDAKKKQLTDGKAMADMAAGTRMISKDGTAAISSISFDKELMDVSMDSKADLMKAINDTDMHGVKAHFGTDLARTMPQMVGPGEIAGVVIAGIVLLLMLGTLIGAGLPLINALLGVGIAVTTAMAFSGIVDMFSVTPVLGLMLGLAVGIDYSLFILNRHRKQLLRGMGLIDSIGVANGTSGGAVVFAGSTVIIALLALNVTGISIVGMMGTVGAFAVLTAILVAITLTPALLKLIGLRILPKKAREGLGQHPKPHTLPAPMGTMRATVTVVAGLLVLAALAIPSLNMRLGLPDASSEAKESEVHQTYKIMQDKFGDGMNGPLLAVAELDKPIAQDAVTSKQVEIGKQINKLAEVAAVVPVGASDNHKLIAYQVVPKHGPSAKQTETLVHQLRDMDHGYKMGVAGSTSAMIDVSEVISDALVPYLLIVIGLSFLILMVVFRSILVPLTATIGFALSVLGAFGGVTWVFQEGHLASLFNITTPGPVLSFLPIIMTGILFGLAMDYQLFLVSGMKEAHSKGIDARTAVREGLHSGRTVVIAAATIMTAVFAGFIFNSNPMIKSIGFGLTLGIILDAFIVRLLVIPALMHLLGDAAWWLPKWLDKILPHLDVEGANLSVPASAKGDGSTAV